MKLFSKAEGTVARRPIYVASTLGLRTGETCATRCSGIRNGVLRVEKQLQRQKRNGVSPKRNTLFAASSRRIVAVFNYWGTA